MSKEAKIFDSELTQRKKVRDRLYISRDQTTKLYALAKLCALSDIVNDEEMLIKRKELIRYTGKNQKDVYIIGYGHITANPKTVLSILFDFTV